MKERRKLQNMKERRKEGRKENRTKI